MFSAGLRRRRRAFSPIEFFIPQFPRARNLYLPLRRLTPIIFGVREIRDRPTFESAQEIVGVPCSREQNCRFCDPPGGNPEILRFPRRK